MPLSNTPLLAQLNYALVYDSSFYTLEIRGYDYAPIIWQYNLGDSTLKKTYIPGPSNSFFPDAWGIIDSVCISSEGFGDFPTRGSLVLNTKKVETRDSVTINRLYDQAIDSLTQVYGNEQNAKAAYRYKYDVLLRNSRTIVPLYDWFIASYLIGERDLFLTDILGYTWFDYRIESINDLFFFIRNKHELSVWKYYYPPIEVSREDQHWEEIVTYSNLFGPYHPGFHLTEFENLTLARGEQHVFQSISDSLFFVGEYEVIRQDTNDFIINTSHGAIYVLTPNQIVKVGQIQNIENHPAGWFIKTDYPLFIEDQDKGELVLFTEVERITDAYPFPKMVVIPDKATARHRFGYLIRP